MPAEQSDPPQLDHLAPPWFHKTWESLRQWLIDNRIVTGLDVELVDADGRGKSINVKKGKGGVAGGPCHFALFVAGGTEDNPEIGIKYGTICKRCPVGFNPQGLIKPFKPGKTANRYFYAAASFNKQDLSWVNPVVIMDASATKKNTSSTAYALIGMTGMVDNVFTLSPPACEDVSFDPCDLVFTQNA